MILKSLGEAATDLERTLEAALSKAEIFAGRDLSYAPVHGGISNSNFRVFVDGQEQSYFVKIPGAGTEMFIDRRAAFDASRKAASAGIGPRVYDDLFDDSIEINDFIPDRRPCTNSDFAVPERRAAAIQAYRTLHGIEALTLTKTVFDMIEEHAAQIEDLNGWLPPDYDWLYRQYRLARQALEASGLDMTPCFNDPMAGNFMLGDDGSIMLIDFEYASMNDRCYDLGIWFGEMFFTPEQEFELIEAYFGTVRQSDVSRITVHKALADVKWSLWSFVQQRVSKLDFDYFKYGQWKLMRLRSIMNAPDWAAHLKRV
ncbi:phosphotransferase [Microbaculum marinisediminis]|uniref:Phosphotransferase n=1 Tax=Microbaculum marinisediminis TaxID=2931392 RepID=A0AAW5R586_9HYPH|nr:phosphotransferase [Microbaculum sp. A6E488]MCT8974294.1 phosphotransferase [Microbaculum sp. A6E488]